MSLAASPSTPSTASCPGQHHWVHPRSTVPGARSHRHPRPGQRWGRKGRVGFVPSSSDVIGAFYNQG